MKGLIFSLHILAYSQHVLEFHSADSTIMDLRPCQTPQNCITIIVQKPQLTQWHKLNFNIKLDLQ